MMSDAPSPKNGNGNGNGRSALELPKTGSAVIDAFLALGVRFGPWFLLFAAWMWFIQIPDSQERREALRSMGNCQQQMVLTVEKIKDIEAEQSKIYASQRERQDQHFRECAQAHAEQNKRLIESYDVLKGMLSRLPVSGKDSGG